MISIKQDKHVQDYMTKWDIIFVSCTLYKFLLVTSTIIGLISFIIGIIGTGVFIPTAINYENYLPTKCFVVDIDDDRCQDSCYYIMWSVQYYISNRTTSRLRFSTITETYDTADESSKQLEIYHFRSNLTCYYNKQKILHVQWRRPASPVPYMIMMIIGFIFSGIYLGFLIVFYYYRPPKSIAQILPEQY